MHFVHRWIRVRHYALNVPTNLYENVCVDLFGPAKLKIPLKKKAHPKNKLTKKGYNEFIYVWLRVKGTAVFASQTL